MTSIVYVVNAKNTDTGSVFHPLTFALEKMKQRVSCECVISECNKVGMFWTFQQSEIGTVTLSSPTKLQIPAHTFRNVSHGKPTSSSFPRRPRLRSFDSTRQSLSTSLFAVRTTDSQAVHWYRAWPSQYRQ